MGGREIFWGIKKIIEQDMQKHSMKPNYNYISCKHCDKFCITCHAYVTLLTLFNWTKYEAIFHEVMHTLSVQCYHTA